MSTHLDVIKAANQIANSIMPFILHGIVHGSQNEVQAYIAKSIENAVFELCGQQPFEGPNTPIGINLRSLLDGELAMYEDFSAYNERNEFITKLEKRLIENEWITISAGTTFTRTFIAGLDRPAK